QFQGIETRLPQQPQLTRPKRPGKFKRVPTLQQSQAEQTDSDN
ncbi:18999_t:CDS:1, partial [Dentiscutata erythropus]